MPTEGESRAVLSVCLAPAEGHGEPDHHPRPRTHQSGDGSASHPARRADGPDDHDHVGGTTGTLRVDHVAAASGEPPSVNAGDLTLRLVPVGETGLEGDVRGAVA